MRQEQEAELLRIFVDEADKYQKRPLYEALVAEAHRQGLAGATVLRGVIGYGAGSRIHTAKIMRLSEDLPLIVEIVDTPEKIASFLHSLDEMMVEGLVTLEKVRCIRYRREG